MSFCRYHGCYDEVRFVAGCPECIASEGDPFDLDEALADDVTDLELALEPIPPAWWGKRWAS